MNQYYQEPPQYQFTRPRITWAVQRLILANALIFLAQLLLDPVQFLAAPAVIPGLTAHTDYPGGILLVWFGFQPGLFLNYFLIWKPFTYMFLHSGLMHLFFNMLWLFIFGPDVERRLGTMHFVRFYIACGAASVLVTIFPYILSGDNVSVIGASGATMGVLVAFAILDPNRQFYLIPFPWPITARGLVILIVAMEILRSFGDSNVSVATHFGGMLFGFAYMKGYPAFSIWWRKRQWKPSRKAKATQDDPGEERVGEAVDNIFKFKDPKDH